MRRRSDINDVICGVPTRIYPGPTIIFNLYFTILLLSQANCIMFCLQDDTNVFISGNNLKETLNILFTLNLIKLYAWLQSNKLTFESVEKTLYGVFIELKHKKYGCLNCV